MKIRLPLEKTTLFLLLGIVCSLLRPTVFGEVFSLPIAALISFVVLLILASGKLPKSEFGSTASLQLFLLLLAYLYMHLRAAVEPGASNTDWAKGILLGTLTTFVLYVASRRKSYITNFFDGAALVILLSSASITISFLLLIAGFGKEQLLIGHMDYTYRNMGDILFPFTFAFNYTLGIFDFAIPRLNGIYREPGCVPAFATWAAGYLYLRMRSQAKWACIAILLSSCYFCLSTTGFIFIYSLVLIIGVLKRWNIAVVLLAITAFALLYWQVIYQSEIFGIAAKVNSGSGSFERRSENTLAIFETKNIIFGDGNNWSTFAETTGINLLSATRNYGFIYLLMILAIMTIPVRRNFVFTAVCLAPPFVIVSLFQPFVLDPAFAILPFSWLVFAPTKSSHVFWRKSQMTSTCSHGLSGTARTTL